MRVIRHDPDCNGTASCDATEALPQPSTRDRIVAASFQLFLLHGFDGTGLSMILGATGLSKGAFYHYFADQGCALS